MTTAKDRGLTKLTAKIWAPLYAGLDQQISNALLRRDAFLDRMISQEIPYLREDLEGKQLSPEANRHISHSLKRLGLRQVSIAVRPETADALRGAVETHNLVRDAFINRLIALLRSSDRFLQALGLPDRIRWGRGDGTEDMPTSPLRAIEETLGDPLYYIRAACQTRYDCGLHLLEFPVQLMGLYCHLDDDQVPGTIAYKEREEADKLLLEGLEIFETNLTPIKTQGV